MTDAWLKFSPAEMERRRKESVAALRARERADFDRWYQQRCDEMYWKRGKCCAGCDHWQSGMGNLGHCISAGIVSGDQVMRSMGVSFCSYTPPPGFPLTEANFYCGMFKDDFDWSTLEPEYLAGIGAMRHGALKEKPTQPIAQEGET